MDTKIIATIGPASEDYGILKRLAEQGVNIIRINFSHASYDQYRRLRKEVQEIVRETGKDLKIIQDLQGPRIRVGELSHEIEMKEGETYTFMYNEGNINNLEIPIDHKELIDDVRAGEHFYLNNGTIELEITEVRDGKIIARVERGGLLTSRKGINLPQTNLKSGGLTDKDFNDARFALREGVDYIALSFVQSAADIHSMRAMITQEFPNQTPPKLIAKIERATALPVIDEIIKASDGIMIARGDLGIETPIEDLPILQKNLVRHAHWHNKPAIVATEMMTSMIEHPKPTRAEVADVANAIFDGADGVMLSDETAIGRYPLETVMMMKKIIGRTDDYFNSRNYFDRVSISHI